VTITTASRKAGDRQQRVDQPPEHRVDPAAEEAGEQPDQAAGEQADADRHQGGAHRRAGAVDDPGELVAAEVVGPEPVLLRSGPELGRRDWPVTAL
jgi:hypothetical protein